MKTIYLFIVSLFLTFNCYSQTGTSYSSPFTSLTQASTVTTAGIYYFNLSGTKFKTYVNNKGWVQVAIDFGGSTGNLPTDTALKTTSRGILKSTVLAKLTETVVVRMSSSDNSFDVATINTTIVNRVINNQTLHRGVLDTTINKSWTGKGSTHMGGGTNVAGSKVFCTTSSGSTLPANIFHPCGDGNSTHWVPSANMHTEITSGPEVSSSIYFQLWVRSAIVVPIKLEYFKATETANKQVALDWKTTTEINNDYFTIERSLNSITWETVAIIKGAGNSESEINYHSIDKKPYNGVSYYRLKQTDLDGKYSYSKIQKIQLKDNVGSAISIYPNPTIGSSEIEGKSEIGAIQVFNFLGENVTSSVKIIVRNKMHVTIDVSLLQKGIYIVKTKNGNLKLFRL